MARWVRRRDRTGRVLVIPNQKSGVLETYRISREEADRSAWAVDGTGRRWEGAAAINRALRHLGGYPAWLAAVYALRPAAAAEEALYRWFAPRRSRFHRFGVRPECDDGGCG
ncbi:MAG TPA: DCC1-like thiol-disulfide oxidoreductase family protein [Candidatus Dormibacteraeota bacterium]|jgi:predicted DCC family thiol-disulfide oxidoreductase YuxK